MKKAIKWTIKILFTLSLFLLIFHPEFFGIKKHFIPVTLGQLKAEVLGIDLSHFWKWILFAFAVKAAGMLSSMIRWDLLLKGQGIRLPFRHLFGTFLTGRFFGMFLPSTIGLDGYRLYDVARHTGKVIESTTVILIEKLIGFIALTLLVFITLPLGMHILEFRTSVLAAILFVLAAFIAVSFVLLFNPNLLRIFLGLLPLPGRRKIEKTLQHISLAVTAYSGQRALLLKALFWGVMVHTGTILMYFGTMMAIKAQNVSIADILFASPLMIYGTVLGPSIGGEGIREIVFALLLGPSAGHAKAILFAHLGFWIGEILSLAGGVFYLLRPPEYKPSMILEDLEKIRAKGRDTREVQMEDEKFHRDLDRAKANARVHLASGALGGLFAGVLVGLAEAVLVVASLPGLKEASVLHYAVAAYGALGLAVGLGMGIAGVFVSAALGWGADRARTLGAYVALVFLPLVLFIARFRVKRDLLHDHPLSLMQNIEVVLAVLAAAVLLYLAVSRILGKGRAEKWTTPLKSGLALAGIYTAAHLASAILSAGGAGPIASRPVPADLKDRPNIILLMVDTLRADHVSCYGHPGGLTPNLDALAAEGVRYEHMTAQSSWTKPSSASLLTSMYSSSHQTYGKADVLPGSVVTVTEALSNAGYLTAGMVSVVHLSAPFGFDQGFDEYQYLAPDYFFGARESSSKLVVYDNLRLVRERFVSKRKYFYHFYQDSRVINERALDWLSRHRDDRFFLYLHYMDPHDPYFEHPYNGVGVARVHTPNPPADRAERLRALYEGEVRYMDQGFGELIDGLKRLGLYRDTLIAVTADHGEEFYEHGGWWHGTTLYGEQVNVPLIIKPPASFEGRLGSGPDSVEQRVVRTIDVAPTLLDSAGAEPAPGMQGVSLLAPYDKRREKDRFAYAEEDFEGNVLHAVRTEQWKLILANPGNPRGLELEEFFDLEGDPGETRNLAADPDYGLMKDHFTQRLETIKAYAEGKAVQGQKRELTPEDLERMRALGYVDDAGK